MRDARAVRGSLTWIARCGLEPGRRQHPRSYSGKGRETVPNLVSAEDGDGNRMPTRDEHACRRPPPLDTWRVIPTAPYKGSHYATFPPALVVKPVLAMCPDRGLHRAGGEPSRRIVDVTWNSDVPARPLRDDKSARRYWSIGERQTAQRPRSSDTKITNTTGWTDCSHNSWRPGVVLDPFAGSGTVLSVASGHGRDSIGIDLDSRNAELAREGVGMFLTVGVPGGSRMTEWQSRAACAGVDPDIFFPGPHESPAPALRFSSATCPVKGAACLARVS